jgi:hypothetical protein
MRRSRIIVEKEQDYDRRPPHTELRTYQHRILGLKIWVRLCVDRRPKNSRLPHFFSVEVYSSVGEVLIGGLPIHMLE